MLFKGFFKILIHSPHYQNIAGNLDSNCFNLGYHSILYFHPQQACVVSNYDCSLEQHCGMNFSTQLLPDPPCKVWLTFLSVSWHLTHSQRASGSAGSVCQERNCAKIHFLLKVCWAGQIKYESGGTQDWLQSIFIETDWQMSHSLSRLCTKKWHHGCSPADASD